MSPNDSRSTVITDPFSTSLRTFLMTNDPQCTQPLATQVLRRRGGSSGCRYLADADLGGRLCRTRRPLRASTASTVPSPLIGWREVTQPTRMLETGEVRCSVNGETCCGCQRSTGDISQNLIISVIRTGKDSRRDIIRDSIEPNYLLSLY